MSGTGSARTAPSGGTGAGGYNEESSLARISLRELLVEVCIGVPERERRRPQTLIVNLDLFLDVANAAGNDAISETVNYSELAVFIRRLPGHLGPLSLLETLADEVAKAVLARYPEVQSLRVAVRKPHVVPRSGGAEVELRRSRTFDNAPTAHDSPTTTTHDSPAARRTGKRP